MKKILLLSDLSREPDRQTIRGITRFLDNGEGWTPYHLPPFMRYDESRIDDIVNRARALKVDAIFGAWPVVEGGVKLPLDIPIVLKPSKTRVRGFSEFRSNSEKIGLTAADFFNSLGYKHLSFSGMPGLVWSSEREKFFRQYAKGKVHRAVRFTDPQSDYDKISNWLKALPKPVGIFCCNDVNASMIVEICIGNGIKIPDEVAILGVDDDEFLCNITSPTISSIRLDYEKAGYEIASRLSAAVDSGAKESFIIIHDPVCVVERNSTPTRIVKDPYIKIIVEFMKAHYQEGIGVKEAVAPIPLSRRSIEIRFKKEFGSVTMLDYLTRLKVEKMKDLLVSTNMPLLDIAVLSGFSESENIYRMFKKNVGCTPAAFRAAHCQADRF